VSQENVEIARRGFLALERGDIDAAAEFWHPEISWRAAEGAPDDVGEMHGIEAARRYVEDWFDTFDDFRSEPQELIPVGDDQVVVVHIGSGRAKRSGIESELRYASVATLHDGKIVRVREYLTKSEALKAVGLEE
jgi:ketosteroid isomerase-like protein